MNSFSQKKNRKGITLLLVILIVTSLMTIALSIFNFIITELKISGETADSFYAFAAADQGMEKTLYVDRIIGASDGYTENKTLSDGKSCYTATIDKHTVASTTIITSLGKYDCTVGAIRQSTRSLQTSYQ